MDALLPANDPVARNIVVMRASLETYSLAFGQLATPAELRQRGLWFFELTNPYTGAPLANRCDQVIAGDFCLILPNPYSMTKLVFYDRDGNEVWFPGMRSKTIAGPHHNRPGPGWGPFLRRQPTDPEVKAFLLGQLLTHVFWNSPVAKTDEGAGFLALLSQPPFNKLNDTWTGQTLAFDGSGYGDRVKFLRSLQGTWFTKVYLPGGTLAYSEEFNLVSSVANGLAFSAIRVPAVIAGEPEPPIL
jgi:hypothetical protein